MLQTDALTGKLVHLTHIDFEQDVPEIFKWHVNIDYIRYLAGGSPRFYTLQQMKDWLSSDPDSHDMPPMAIRRRDTNELIGICSYKDTNPTVRSCLFWLGIRPTGNIQGKGYGTDTVKVMLRYAFQEMNMQRIGLQVAEFNVPARRVYEKCGFQLEGTIRRAMFRDGRYWDMHYMGILREEWAASQPNSDTLTD